MNNIEKDKIYEDAVVSSSFSGQTPENVLKVTALGLNQKDKLKEFEKIYNRFNDKS